MPAAASRRWLVDGSNVVGSRPDGWWRDRRAAFARMAEELDHFAGAGDDEVTVVFDGGPLPPVSGSRVHVVCADSADDRIVELASADADQSSLTAVTSDRALAERVRRTGATVMGAGSFRRRLDDAGRRVP
ncbi:MAG: NYN domain-containing protein [Actinomycetota bacterium]|nr:NYN domain-containing protein [Actinomycetota bacterium]